MLVRPSFSLTIFFFLLVYLKRQKPEVDPQEQVYQEIARL